MNALALFVNSNYTDAIGLRQTQLDLSEVPIIKHNSIGKGVSSQSYLQYQNSTKTILQFLGLVSAYIYLNAPIAQS